MKDKYSQSALDFCQLLPGELAELVASLPKHGLADLSRKVQGRESVVRRTVPHDGIKQNSVMFQGFEWYVPSDHKHWNRLGEIIPALTELGVDCLWIPPACKAWDQTRVGYDLYDLYDIGEFNQKGGITTKWGTKEELLSLIHRANDNGVKVLFDVVVNHMAAADYTEDVEAIRVGEFSKCNRIPSFHSQTPLFVRREGSELDNKSSRC